MEPDDNLFMTATEQIERQLERVARIAHEANRAYCQSIGDNSLVPWDESPDWLRNSGRDGVRFHLNNPGVAPEASHANWLKFKKADGWTWGPKKDPELKQHPCCVPYDELPLSQKLKDSLFMAVCGVFLPGLRAMLNPTLVDVKDLGNGTGILEKIGGAYVDYKSLRTSLDNLNMVVGGLNFDAADVEAYIAIRKALGDSDKDYFELDDGSGIFHVSMDGNAISICRPDFTNLQESPCGFGKTVREALIDFRGNEP